MCRLFKAQFIHESHMNSVTLALVVIGLDDKDGLINKDDLIKHSHSILTVYFGPWAFFS